MTQARYSSRLKQSLCAILISALLLTQQGVALGSGVLAGANTFRARPLVNAGVAVRAPQGGLALLPESLAHSFSHAGLRPSIIPAGPIGSAPFVPLAAPGLAASAKSPRLDEGQSQAAAPAVETQITQLSQRLLPDLQALADPELSANASRQVGERVMDSALGLQAPDLPVLAEGAADSGPETMRLRGDSWWKDPSVQHLAASVPIYAMRRDFNDPGIGKFSDLGAYYRDFLSKRGVDTVHILPHLAVLDESPYAPVSLYALNESYIDWAQVEEVRQRPDWLARLKVRDLPDKQAVNYPALRQRESEVAEQAYQVFQRANSQDGVTPRWQEYLDFISNNSWWLDDYAEFMSLSSMLNKPALEWTEEDERQARSDPRFAVLKNIHFYAQWNAYKQCDAAIAMIRQAGGHAIFDLPMFRSKNSVDAWKHPEYFTDLRTRNPGVVNETIHEDWKDLALWNWTKLKAEDYRLMLDPVSHWLALGFEGIRADALHFAYNFGKGQIVSGDEPGDDYVRALSSILQTRAAFPLAEALDGQAEKVESFGFVTVYGDWKVLSNHDLPRQDGFMGRFLDLSQERTSGRNGRFVAYTLGDEWGDPFPVKEFKDGKSYWHYRIPMPSDPDYKNRVRNDARGQLGAWRAVQEGNIWKAVEALWSAMKIAGDSFVKHFYNSVQIWAASMDWFLEEWGRDTFISLPGLLLATGRSAEAKENMRNFARFEHNGLIPNRIWDASRWFPAQPDGVDYNTVDGPMWFIQAVKKYVEYTNDYAFVGEMLPVMRRIIRCYISGTGFYRYGRFNRIYMDSDGLIVGPAQATWMDADPDGRGQPVTPRNGKAVEINALWYANLRFLARLERRSGGQAADLDAQADLVKKSFNDKFWFVTEDNKRAWGETGGALRDVVEGDPHSNAVRPNMLFAVSHGEDLLTPERQRAVVLAATKDLLTPYGMRSLSYRDSRYRGIYETWKPALERDQAYHQGTVWPWLMGPYVDALARVRRAQGWDEGRVRDEVRGIMTPLVEFLVTSREGSLPEVFDGGKPQDALLGFSLADPVGLRDLIMELLRNQNRGGTRSQAWSVGEALRVLLEYGLTDGTGGAWSNDRRDAPETTGSDFDEYPAPV